MSTKDPCLENKILKMKAKLRHYQVNMTCLTKNPKGSSSGWKEMVLDSSSKIHKEIKNMSKGNYVVKRDSVKIFFLFSTLI